MMSAILFASERGRQRAMMLLLLWTFVAAEAPLVLAAQHSRAQTEQQWTRTENLCCTIVPHVDRHVLRNGMDVSLTPVLGMVWSPECGPVSQHGFKVQLRSPTGTVGGDLVVETNRSYAIPFATWRQGLGPSVGALQPGTSYQVMIAPVLKNKTVLDYSDPVDFHTQFTSDQYNAVTPMWFQNTTAKFVMFRRVLERNALPDQVFLAITAKPSPDWIMPHGRNTSHLLCAYKLWVNSIPLGTGPGRKVGGAISVDTYNLTAILNEGMNTVAVESFYQQERHASDPDDRGGVVVLLHDVSGNMVAGGVEGWKTFDATAAFAPTLGGTHHGAGTGSYDQPYENIDVRLYPSGWRSNHDNSSGWTQAAARPRLADGLKAKEALPVSLRHLQPAGFSLMGGVQRGAGAQSTYHYIVDFGKNFQGHVNITFESGYAGQQVVVRLGEQLNSDGSVKYRLESNNVYEFNWTLSGTNGTQNFVPHEYCVFRWAEVIGAPEMPTLARVAGWQVQYPFDGDLNEYGMTVRSPLTTNRVKQPGLTEIVTDSAALNAVWSLASYTAVAATIDLNTDSNTRQRDLCSLDAFVTTRYQGGTAPATSAHHRRRVSESLFELNGYVNYWTEFLVSHIWALHDYTIEYDDVALATMLWHASPINLTTEVLGMDNYSLLAYFNHTDNLVHSTPKPLVDWVRSNTIDTSMSTASHCNKLCVQMNSYASLSQGWMGDLATRIGGATASEAAAYKERSINIREAANAKFSAFNSQCNVSGGPTPGPTPVPQTRATCGIVWEKDTANHHHNSTGTLTLNCGTGHEIESIIFADYGSPTGSCVLGFQHNSSCSTPDALAVVSKACIHKQYCILAASDSLFGDGCRGTCKQLAVQVTCSSRREESQQHKQIPDPPKMNCYADEMVDGFQKIPSTTATGSSLAALARLPGSASGVLALVPFLQARQGRRGPAHGVETSGWMTGFMMEGLYSAAGEVNEGLLSTDDVAAAAAFCYNTLVNEGENSWLGMMRVGNATMTMESWPGGGGGTYSHPWTASPAWIIPRYLMGIRPLADGWERIAIRPLPVPSLTSGNISVLTPRGAVNLGFSLSSSSIATSITVPGNTFAEVCLPRYLFGSGAQCSATMGGSTISTNDAGGLTCLRSDLGGGHYDIVLHCTA